MVVALSLDGVVRTVPGMRLWREKRCGTCLLVRRLIPCIDRSMIGGFRCTFIDCVGNDFIIFLSVMVR